jgi:hypothetical protein
MHKQSWKKAEGYLTAGENSQAVQKILWLLESNDCLSGHSGQVAEQAVRG